MHEYRQAKRFCLIRATIIKSWPLKFKRLVKANHKGQSRIKGDEKSSKSRISLEAIPFSQH